MPLNHAATNNEMDMMLSETIHYQADGLSMQGQLFRPRDTTRAGPAVLVFPEAFGPGEHALSKAEKIASEGYIALTCDLHGNGKVLSDFQELTDLLTPLVQSSPKVRARAKGALDALTAQAGVDRTRVGAIGYCFGGAMAIELGASGADIAAIVGFHSGLGSIAVDDLKHIKGRLLLCLGADDPGIPPTQRIAFEAALREGDVRWDMLLFGHVVHSFTNPAADALGRPSMRYDARADVMSFEAMLDLFRETIG